MKYLIKFICAFIPVKSWRKRARTNMAYMFWAKKILSLCKGEHGGKFQIISPNLGETTVFCLTFKYWYKGGNIVLTKNYHKDLFDIFLPDVHYIFCERPLLCLPEKKSFEYKRNDFEEVLTGHEIISMNSNKKRFFDNWQEYLGVDLSRERFVRPIITDNVRVIATSKANRLRIDIGKFIFVATEAQSCSALSDEFWKSITEEAYKNGYDVFFNKSKGNIGEVLTVEEVVYLASKSKMIIGIRSGLMDVLCMLDVPMRVIYTDNDLHGDIQPMYTLKQFPYCSKNLYEYNLRYIKKDEIVSAIVSDIKNLL